MTDEEEAYVARLFKHREMLFEAIEKIKEGCKKVKEETGIHKDAHSLATEVIRDCNKAIRALEGDEND